MPRLVAGAGLAVHVTTPAHDRLSGVFDSAVLHAVIGLGLSGFHNYKVSLRTHPGVTLPGWAGFPLKERRD